VRAVLSNYFSAACEVFQLLTSSFSAENFALGLQARAICTKSRQSLAKAVQKSKPGTSFTGSWSHLRPFKADESGH
jgi:hypothetical protein